jgi:hypothetical protein
MSGRSNVEIRNGTIRNFGNGIYEAYTAGTGHRVIDVRAIGNKLAGIYLVGYGHQIKGCTSSDNGISANTNQVYGIYAGNSAIVTGNTIRNNGKSATVGVFSLMVGEYSTISGNTVTDNGTYSTATMYGIIAGAGCTVISNTVCGNGLSGTGTTAYGVYVSSGNCLVDQNVAYNNRNINMNILSTCTYGTNHAPQQN